jgi:DNA-binding XRE family transcriptional regulator
MADTFRIAVKDWRRRVGLVQKEAADLLGVSLRTYQGWESGRYEPFYLAKIEIERRMNKKENGK